MSLSLLGGFFRGHKLILPSSDLTRPTAAQLKRRIFDACQDLTDYIFIDLCAGSGSIGLEALSRGSDYVYLIEKNRKASSFLKKNVTDLQKKYKDMSIDSRALVYEMDAQQWLKRYWADKWNNEYCIIYLDPPYEDLKTYEAVVHFILESNFCGELWLEGCRQKGKPSDEWLANIPCSKSKCYEQGTSYIIRFIFS